MKMPAEFIPDLTRVLCGFLKVRLPKLAGEAWWSALVVRKLSFAQQQTVAQHGYRALDELDILCLLRVMQGNYQELSIMDDLPIGDKPLLYELASVRHRIAHAGSLNAPWEDVYRDLDTMRRVLKLLKHSGPVLEAIKAAKEAALEQLAPSKVVEVEKIREVYVERKTKTFDPAGFPSIQIGDGVLYGPIDQVIEEEALPSDSNRRELAEIDLFRYQQPDGVDLEIGYYVFESGEQAVFTRKRFESPSSWDNVVGRLRVGIRTSPESPDTSYIQIRSAKRKKPDQIWPTRHQVALDTLTEICELPVEALLTKHGVIQLGTRGELMGDTSRTRNELAAVFKTGDPIPPTLAYVISTVVPFKQILADKI
jgi:hypothetical protein